MSDFPVTDRNRVRTLSKRAAYDRETIYPILDEGLICHVGLIDHDQPFVIPTLYARQEDALLLHGSPRSRLIQHIGAGRPVSIAVTLVDGLVIARSAFHHSINYRSVVLFGTGRVLVGEEERMQALETLTEHIVRGRWRDAREPTPQELNATTVVSLTIESASAKARSGAPVDADEDYALPVWAGVLPFSPQISAPIPDSRLSDGIPIPDYIRDYTRKA